MKNKKEVSKNKKRRLTRCIERHEEEEVTAEEALNIRQRKEGIDTTTSSTLSSRCTDHLPKKKRKREAQRCLIAPFC